MWIDVLLTAGVEVEVCRVMTSEEKVEVEEREADKGRGKGRKRSRARTGGSEEGDDE